MSTPTLRIAASGMAAQQVRTDVIAHNLANVATTGFKASRANFEDLLYQNVRDAAVLDTPDAKTAAAIQVGRGVRLSSVQRLHTQGTLDRTERALDLSIEGEGFFQVQLPNGQLGYTRAGNLEISDQGVLTTPSGYALEPQIRVPSDASSLTISKTGIVSVLRGNSTDPVEIGRIEIARFINPTGLEAEGENIYRATAAAGEPQVGMPGDEGFGRLEQGALEGSNVSVVEQMVDMISAMRAYELNSKAVKSAEEMEQIANGLLR